MLEKHRTHRDWFIKMLSSAFQIKKLNLSNNFWQEGGGYRFSNWWCFIITGRHFCINRWDILFIRSFIISFVLVICVYTIKNISSYDSKFEKLCSTICLGWVILKFWWILCDFVVFQGLQYQQWLLHFSVLLWHIIC